MLCYIYYTIYVTLHLRWHVWHISIIHFLCPCFNILERQWMNSRLVRLKTASFFFSDLEAPHTSHVAMFGIDHSEDCDITWCLFILLTVRMKSCADRGLRQSSVCFICPHSADCEPLALGGNNVKFWGENALLRHLCADSSVWCVVSSVFFFLQTKTPLWQPRRRIKAETWGEKNESCSKHCPIKAENFPVSKEDCNLQRVGLVYALNVP